MARFESEGLAFQQPLKTMRQSISKLIAGAGLTALALGSAQAAGATTITYSTAKATFVSNNPLSNTRPLQMSASGSGISTARNFIYQDLVGDYAPAGDWEPISQLGPGSTGPLSTGEQRFDYSYGPATSINAGPPQDNKWNNNLNLSFGSFYLNGTCDFCGSANAVSLINASPTGQAEFLGIATDGTPGNQNTLTSSLYNIVFGASGKTGTLKYEAYTNIINGEPGSVQRSETSGGRIIINVFDAPTSVPAPLPIFGAGAAFGYTRRLRRRIQGKAN